MAATAGVSTLRLSAMPKDTCIGLNTLGIPNNNSRETLRCFAAHSLLPTRDLALVHGAAVSRRLRTAQETQPYADFPSFQASRTGRSQSTGSLHSVPPSAREASGGNHHEEFSPAEVVAAGTAGIPLRYRLPAAGVRTQGSGKARGATVSSVNYHLYADQATPIQPYERTAFMSHAHRDAPGLFPC
eukprot:TRINITY_DN26053_c0_g3_i1.p2 TRINITY_DN26053_c0_g3~~TRINITY_DN26053_c0_g3_i1.p2  ORF type:complete len:186 (+),score=30.98 TRINITY_DN26053_c0_g3_i1:65-622(+)